jgi:hypothetical protein
MLFTGPLLSLHARNFKEKNVSSSSRKKLFQGTTIVASEKFKERKMLAPLSVKNTFTWPLASLQARHSKKKKVSSPSRENTFHRATTIAVSENFKKKLHTKNISHNCNPPYGRVCLCPSLTVCDWVCLCLSDFV